MVGLGAGGEVTRRLKEVRLGILLILSKVSGAFAARGLFFKEHLVRPQSALVLFWDPLQVLGTIGATMAAIIFRRFTSLRGFFDIGIGTLPHKRVIRDGFPGAGQDEGDGCGVFGAG